MRASATVFPYAVTGVAADLGGPPMPIGDWARRVPLPNRKVPGSDLDGDALRHIFGLDGKSWAPDHFRDIGTLVATAKAALDFAHLGGGDVDAIYLLSATPHQIILDQDAFHLARALNVRDDIPPVHMGTGCAGLARAAALAARADHEHVLVVTYFYTSLAMFDHDGELLPGYSDNPGHPFGETTWASPVLFSDAAAAVVWSRIREAPGLAFYSRDSHSFAGGPPATDALVHYLGGGTRHPIGTPQAASLACFAMNSPQIRRYYPQGMMLNHRTLLEHAPDYVERSRRIYTHQANPKAVADFVEEAGLPPDKVPSNVKDIGNTVTSATLVMLADDLQQQRAASGDTVCFTMVGSGPERGAILTRLALGGIGLERSMPRHGLDHEIQVV